MEAKQLFNDHFKFSLGEEARHKGDGKNGYNSDMGLLIIQRKLLETQDDDGGSHFTREYVCRMIRFGGSGDLALFRETELLSMTEYNKKVVEQEEERQDMRNHQQEVKKAIFSSFGVERGTEVHLKKEGVVDTTKIYKVSGFETSEKEGTKLRLRIEAGEGRGAEAVDVVSKDEFEVITK